MGKHYNISQMAKMFNITTNKIRFYEKKGLISPAREDYSGYRKFSEDDVIRLQLILLYRSIGLSVDSIDNIFRNSDKENYIAHFNNQWKLVNDEIQRLSIIRNSLEDVIDKIYEETDIYMINDDLMQIMAKSNELNNIKNEWKDKWDFNGWAKSYDEDVKKDNGELKIYKNYEMILQSVYDLAKKSGKDNPRILEIGVGTGNLAGKFLESNYNIIGIDQSRDMLAVAKEKYPSLKVRLGEFLKIPYDNKSFDIIVSTYAFHHLNEDEKIVGVQEMLRVLKDDGIIIIGDLMFESKAAKSEILKFLSENQIEEVEDEYYSYIDLIEKEFKKYNMKLEQIRIDKLNYIVKIGRE